MRWWVRAAWVTVGFVVPCVAGYELYTSSQVVHHDLSDIGTGLVGVIIGLAAGLLGAFIALVMTRNRPH